jgi:hypothetical protein
MKLLTKPDVHMQDREVKIPARRETRFHPLGLFGIGPLTTTRDIPARTVTGTAGRTILKRIEIDFEDEDAITTCIDVGAYDMIKKNTEFTLMLEGEVYIIYGVIPMKLLHDNVWECNIDRFEY